MVATLDEKLILIDIQAEKKEEVLELLARRLEQAGYVRNTYLQAVLEREKKFPTGLPTQPVAIAIPHSDAEHCIRPAVAVATLQTPVVFGLMGDDQATVDARIVFMLALDRQEGQAEFLCRFSNLFKNGDALVRIASSQAAAEIIAAISQCVHVDQVKNRGRDIP